MQVLLSLYMYAMGLQRQAVEVLAHLGLVVSYSLLVAGLGTSTSWKYRKRRKDQVDSNNTATTSKKTPTVGPLKKLSTECMQQLKEIVKSGTPIGFVFDNINLTLKVAEARLGKSGNYSFFSTTAYILTDIIHPGNSRCPYEWDLCYCIRTAWCVGGSTQSREGTCCVIICTSVEAPRYTPHV
jgi:hypothetical protein